MKRNNWKYLRKAILIFADIILFTVVAILIYFDNVSLRSNLTFLCFWGVINVFLLVAGLAILGLYDIVSSVFGLPEILKAFFCIGVIAIINLIYVFISRGSYITIGNVFSFVSLLFVGVISIRSFKRILLFLKYYFFESKKEKTRVMIVGGGEAGASLIREMLKSEKMTYIPVCIVDDANDKIGKQINGVKIVGDVNSIPENAEKYKIGGIFIAIPSASKKRISEIVKICQSTKYPTKILPGMYQLAAGQVTVSQFREVDIQDLLGREQVKVNLDEIMVYIEDKIVLVTGGGGSIGSELCRQIATHNPKTLIILDIYENNAYEIEQELKRHYGKLYVLTLIASVRDLSKMRDVFEKYRPQIVFHAAAHKHVPLMETSPNEAVKNNILGTWNVARCADEFGTETFVQISTDKAVNPTNIMGATKRICEMIVQTIGRRSKTTNFVAVRFGNVLGSNGSVIPLFKKQIAEGGPVTVTHKDIIRYFMTIPEAVSLVLQAGAYAKNGQIFVLDMGEPVKIYDLAYNLIKLSGFEPNVDIDIVCTGLRPGEKLFEERLMQEEGLQKTSNGLINIARPIPLDEEKLFDALERLCKEAYKENCDMKELVKELVPTYTIDPRNSIVEALTSKENYAKKMKKKGA